MPEIRCCRLILIDRTDKDTSTVGVDQSIILVSCEFGSAAPVDDGIRRKDVTAHQTTLQLKPRHEPDTAKTGRQSDLELEEMVAEYSDPVLIRLSVQAQSFLLMPKKNSAKDAAKGGSNQIK